MLPGVDPFTYFIQAGAFRTPEDAEQQRARLVLLGVQAKVSEREQSGRTVYRVRLGPFDRKEDADAAKARLDNNSIETALVRVQRLCRASAPAIEPTGELNFFGPDCQTVRWLAFYCVDFERGANRQSCNLWRKT